MHGLVGGLGGELVLEQVQRVEGKRLELRNGGVAQICRQPVSERGHSRADAGVRPVPAQELPDLPPDREQRADGPGGAARRVEPGDQLHRLGELVGAVRRRDRPHVLEPEITRDLVDSPRPFRVCGVWEPHRRLHPYGIVSIR